MEKDDPKETLDVKSVKVHIGKLKLIFHETSNDMLFKLLARPIAGSFIINILTIMPII